jgi:hypothetical protein
MILKARVFNVWSSLLARVLLIMLSIVGAMSSVNAIEDVPPDGRNITRKSSSPIYIQKRWVCSEPPKMSDIKPEKKIYFVNLYYNKFIENWVKCVSKPRKEDPTHWSYRIFNSTTREFSLNGAEKLVKVIRKPRIGIAALIGLTGYMIDEAARLYVSISEIKKEFHKELPENRKVISESRIGLCDFSDFYTVEKYSDEHLMRDKEALLTRSILMSGLHGSLESIFCQIGFLSKYIFELPLTRPMIRDGHKLSDDIKREVLYIDSLRLLSEIAISANDETIKSVCKEVGTVVDEFVKAESHGDGHFNTQGSEVKRLLEEATNLLGIAAGKKCIADRNCEFCEIALNFFSLPDVQLTDVPPKTKWCKWWVSVNSEDSNPPQPLELKGYFSFDEGHFSFNRGFVQYSFLGKTKPKDDSSPTYFELAENNLKIAHERSPFDSTITSNLIFYRYVESWRGDLYLSDATSSNPWYVKEAGQIDGKIDEFYKFIVPLSELNVIEPSNYLARQMRIILLMQKATFLAKNNKKGFEIDIKEAYKDVENIEKNRSKNNDIKENHSELKGFSPDSYYFFPKAQVEAALGKRDEALDSLYKAKFYADSMQQPKWMLNKIENAIQEIKEKMLCCDENQQGRRLREMEFLSDIIDLPIFGDHTNNGNPSNQTTHQVANSQVYKDAYGKIEKAWVDLASQHHKKKFEILLPSDASSSTKNPNLGNCAGKC